MPKEVLSYVLATALIFPEHAAVVEEYFCRDEYYDDPNTHGLLIHTSLDHSVADYRASARVSYRL